MESLNGGLKTEPGTGYITGGQNQRRILAYALNLIIPLGRFLAGSGKKDHKRFHPPQPIPTIR
ncbi:hypothetical protein [Nesterenkonia muleiensis]|uniref:hypothetical protein n=1 Tax=Nesterenkonia muleiensis TaxID=2282648 RepID=UPI001EE43387|nr:hypothetical protein [Nesterenkonia muleiensis]